MQHWIGIRNQIGCDSRNDENRIEDWIDEKCRRALVDSYSKDVGIQRDICHNYEGGEILVQEKIWWKDRVI